MLHATFVRSTIAHANLVGVDVDEARALPGVVAVYTGAELQALLNPHAPPVALFPRVPAPRGNHLATRSVRVVGVPIVLIVAEVLYRAEDAAGLVEVGYA